MASNFDSGLAALELLWRLYLGDPYAEQETALIRWLRLDSVVMTATELCRQLAISGITSYLTTGSTEELLPLIDQAMLSNVTALGLFGQNMPPADQRWGMFFADPGDRLSWTELLGELPASLTAVDLGERLAGQVIICATRVPESRRYWLRRHLTHL